MVKLGVIIPILIFIYIASIGGCGGSGSGDNPTPEPTPIPTLEPTPTPDRDCDFVPDESGEFYTENDCADLAEAFGCADFSFQDDICEVFGCLDCLCDAGSFTFNNVDSELGCLINKADGGCFNSFFDEGLTQCVLLVCLGHVGCGPIP